MELKISCDASVKLKKFSNTQSVKCRVLDYKVKTDTLNGNIKIDGTYIKDDADKPFEFTEIVPFTVVFRDEHFKVKEIEIENFNCNDIVNNGIECHFDIAINYDPVEKEEKKPQTEPSDDLFIEPEFNDELMEDVEEIPVVAGEDEKISEKYDEMLQDILSKRDDNFLEEDEEESELEDDLQAVSDELSDIERQIEDAQPEVIEKPKEKKVNVTRSDKKDSIEPFSKRVRKENYSSYRVYYLSKESEVDQICRKENVSINEVYEDFAKNKRIIIK